MEMTVICEQCMTYAKVEHIAHTADPQLWLITCHNVTRLVQEPPRPSYGTPVPKSYVWSGLGDWYEDAAARESYLEYARNTIDNMQIMIEAVKRVTK